MRCRSFELSLTVLIVLLFVVLHPSAFAATNLDEGKRLYREKKYRESRQYLEKAVSEEPKAWQTHFYLGHTLTALGRYSDAKHQYALCKHSTNNPAVHAHCNKALEQVNSYASKLRPTSASSPAKPGSAKKPESSASGNDQKNEAKEVETDPRKAMIEAKKQEVMDKAEKECKAIMDKVEEQIKDEKANSSQRFRTGETSMSKEREAALKKPAEEQCKKIMDIAKRKARSYR